MVGSRKNRWFSMLAAALFGTIVLAAPSLAADMVEVKNSHGQLAWTLSDLILYGKNGEKAVILKPNDPTDDVIIPPNGTRVFGPVDFEIDRYFVSTQVGQSEFESHVLKVTPLQPRKIGFIMDNKTAQPVVLVIDDQLATFNPQLGAKLPFRNGNCPLVQGVYGAWQPDFQNGTVFGPYSGRATIVDADAVVTVIPLNGPGGGN